MLRIRKRVSYASRKVIAPGFVLSLATASGGEKPRLARGLPNLALGLRGEGSDDCGVIGTAPGSARLRPTPSRASTRLWRAGVFPVGKPPFPCGESNQSQLRLGDSWHEASLQRCPRPDLPWSGVHRRASCPRQLASATPHPWARTCAPCSRARLRCSASPTGAENQEQRVGTNHHSNGVPGPAVHGRAFAGWRPFTPRGGAASAEESAGGARGIAPLPRRCKDAPSRHRPASHAPAGPTAQGRRAGGRLSLVPFFGGAKKGTCSAAAGRNRAVCRSRCRSPMPRCADPSLCSG